MNTGRIVLEVPENTYPINDVWCFLSVDPNGNEGIVSIPSDYGNMPMFFGFDPVPKYGDLIAQIAEIAKITGKKITLVRFSSKEVLQTFE